MKKQIRVVIDIVMTILFLAVMGYHITDNWLHEWLGVLLLILFLVHNVLNIRWYQTLNKGRYNSVRVLQTVTNLLLLAAMVGAMVSGMMLSRDVLSFLNLKAGSFGRRLHMVSTAWAFPLMAVHLGLHWGVVAAKIRKIITGKRWEMVGKLTVLLMFFYGSYAMASRQIWKEMFLLVEFSFFDYEEPALHFFADYTAILALFAAIAYYGKTGIIRRNRSLSSTTQ